MTFMARKYGISNPIDYLFFLILWIPFMSLCLEFVIYAMRIEGVFTGKGSIHGFCARTERKKHTFLQGINSLEKLT